MDNNLKINIAKKLLFNELSWKENINDLFENLIKYKELKLQLVYFIIIKIKIKDGNMYHIICWAAIGGFDHFRLKVVSASCVL